MKQRRVAARVYCFYAIRPKSCSSITACQIQPEELASLLSALVSELPPSLIYAYAGLLEGFSIVNATPNNFALSRDPPLAQDHGLALAGCDLKSGQTFMKSILAQALCERRLGVSGWFSTNILGNRDGEVLADNDCFRSKGRQSNSASSLRNCLRQPTPPLWRSRASGTYQLLPTQRRLEGGLGFHSTVWLDGLRDGNQSQFPMQGFHFSGSALARSHSAGRLCKRFRRIWSRRMAGTVLQAPFGFTRSPAQPPT